MLLSLLEEFASKTQLILFNVKFKVSSKFTKLTGMYSHYVKKLYVIINVAHFVNPSNSVKFLKLKDAILVKNRLCFKLYLGHEDVHISSVAVPSLGEVNFKSLLCMMLLMFIVISSSI